MTPTEFNIAVRDHRDRVFGFAIHFLGNRADAEDVTQDVFVRLWRKRSAVDATTVQPWLLRVARNACVDRYRHLRVHRNVVSETDVETVVSTSESVSPDRWTEQRLFEERLAAALDELQEPHKSIVILREMQGLRYEEICQALDLPMSTVKVYLHRGRRALRQKLTGVYDGHLV